MKTGRLIASSKGWLAKNRDITHNPGSECKRLWVLKNSVFAPNGQIFGDGKCLAIREDRL